MIARKQFSRIGWAFVAFCLVDLGVQMVFGAWIGVWMLLRDMETLNIDFLLLAQISMYVFAFPIFWILMRRIPAWKKPEGESLGIGQFLLWAVVCFGLTYLGNFAGQIVMKISELVTGSLEENPVLDMIDMMNPWMVFLTTVVIAPVMEELMFRKFLIDRIVPYGQKAAVVVSGVAFGLFHGNFYQFFYASFLGMIFAYLYSSTGRLRYNILLHMMINMVGGVVPVMLMQQLDELSPGAALAFLGVMIMGIFMLTSVIATIVLICIFARKLSWFGAWAPASAKGLWRDVLTAPGVIGFLAVCVMMFFIN